MKTRLVEVPVCDRCSRDGEILVVSTAVGGSFTICRCAIHLDKLQREGELVDDVTGVPSEGHEADRDFLAVLQASPGEQAKFYASALNLPPQKIGKIAARLIEQGRLRKEGRGKNTRYVLVD